jgi:hypothetical protein
MCVYAALDTHAIGTESERARIAMCSESEKADEKRMTSPCNRCSEPRDLIPRINGSHRSDTERQHDQREHLIARCCLTRGGVRASASTLAARESEPARPHRCLTYLNLRTK